MFILKSLRFRSSIKSSIYSISIGFLLLIYLISRLKVVISNLSFLIYKVIDPYSSFGSTELGNICIICCGVAFVAISTSVELIPKT